MARKTPPPQHREPVTRNIEASCRRVTSRSASSHGSSGAARGNDTFTEEIVVSRTFVWRAGSSLADLCCGRIRLTLAIMPPT